MIKAIIFDLNGTLIQKEAGLFPETLGVLQKLKDKNLILILITKGIKEKRQKQVREYGLESFFDLIVYAPDKDKNDFLQAIKNFNLSPEEVLVVDDRTVRGIKIANELSVKNVWIKKGRFAEELPNLETGEPTHIIYNLIDFLEIFKNYE